MFTGIVAELGSVSSVEAGEAGLRLRIDTGLAAELSAGDSISVNGCCLTAARVVPGQGEGPGAFEADVMLQTMGLTTTGDLAEGVAVNLELAVRAADRLGGHIVQGHVDAVTQVTAVTEDGFARRLRFAIPPGLEGCFIERGSVALDGVSLTISALGEDWFEVGLIPETLDRTTLGSAGPGTRVNLECDVVARYVQRMLGMSTLRET